MPENGHIHPPAAAVVMELTIRQRADGQIDILGPELVMRNPPMFYWLLKSAELYMDAVVQGGNQQEGGQILVAPAGALPPRPPGS